MRQALLRQCWPVSCLSLYLRVQEGTGGAIGFRVTSGSLLISFSLPFSLRGSLMLIVGCAHYKPSMKTFLSGRSNMLHKRPHVLATPWCFCWGCRGTIALAHLFFRLGWQECRTNSRADIWAKADDKKKWNFFSTSLNLLFFIWYHGLITSCMCIMSSTFKSAAAAFS